MSRFLTTVAVLTLVYCLTLASFAPLDIAFGALLSTILLWVSHDFVFGPGPAREPTAVQRFFAFFPFAVALMREVLIGTVAVVAITLNLKPRPQRGIVAVPIGERTDNGIAVWAIVTGLPPGSVFVDVDWERQVVLIHLIDARDPDGYRRKAAEFYRRYQSKVFP